MQLESIDFNISSNSGKYDYVIFLKIKSTLQKDSRQEKLMKTRSYLRYHSHLITIVKMELEVLENHVCWKLKGATSKRIQWILQVLLDQ